MSKVYFGIWAVGSCCLS